MSEVCPTRMRMHRTSEALHGCPLSAMLSASRLPGPTASGRPLRLAVEVRTVTPRSGRLFRLPVGVVDGLADSIKELQDLNNLLQAQCTLHLY
jgi:hypothetical protein